MQDAKFLHLPSRAAPPSTRALVALDANGYAIPGKKATGLTAAGRAEETVENKGADGEAFIRVARGVFVFNNTATTSNKIGAATSSSLATSRAIRPSPLLRPGLPPLVWSFA